MSEYYVDIIGYEDDETVDCLGPTLRSGGQSRRNAACRIDWIAAGSTRKSERERNYREGRAR